ncbi:MAG: anti-phage BREX system Lon protease BrxL, partial [Chloroflexota bacterium]
MELDDLDKLAARAFEGFVVRKDLARMFKGQYPVPTYVGEFLLGRYCATTDETEIAEGLQIVEQQMRDRDPRQREFTVQLRAFDLARSGSHLGLPALLA